MIEQRKLKNMLQGLSHAGKKTLSIVMPKVNERDFQRLEKRFIRERESIVNRIGPERRWIQAEIIVRAFVGFGLLYCSICLMSLLHVPPVQAILATLIVWFSSIVLMVRLPLLSHTPNINELARVQAKLKLLQVMADQISAFPVLDGTNVDVFMAKDGAYLILGENGHGYLFPEENVYLAPENETVVVNMSDLDECFKDLV